MEVVTTEHVEDSKVDLTSKLREFPVTEQLKQGGGQLIRSDSALTPTLPWLT